MVAQVVARSRQSYGSLSESAVEPEPASETNEVVSRSSACQNLNSFLTNFIGADSEARSSQPDEGLAEEGEQGGDS
jgi:hypothetical protein